MPSPSWNVELVNHHQPALASGDYLIEVTQTIKVSGAAVVQTVAATQAFSVLGPRFTLSPHDVHAVFPPPGSVGDHAGVLPHVLLERSTLPWERSPDHVERPSPAERLPPWLALIIVHQDEELRVRIGADDKAATNPLRVRTGTVNEVLPQFEPEAGEKGSDALTFIEIDRGFVAAILPTVDQLTKLAHVRRSRTEPVDGHEVPWEEFAVVLCNRPPNPGRNTVHLVSVEGRYDTGGTFAVAAGEDAARLVCLKSWQFTTRGGDQDVRRLLEGLTAGNLCLSISSPNGAVSRKLRMGAVPLPHARMDGTDTVSWYRGPLTPFDSKAHDLDIAALTVHEAAKLVDRDSASGIDDVSHAAAWELGRLMALENTAASTALYNWKRACYHEVQVARARAAGIAASTAHLPLTQQPPEFAFPRAWFEQLARLGGVPFNYLVPDERMLPHETIQFFCVDRTWITWLISGALSVGSTSVREFEACAAEALRELSGLPRVLSGFLLRSDAVSGWPALEVDGYCTVPGTSDAPAVPVAPLQPVSRPSKDVLMCFFEGVIEAVDIHLPPEGLHFKVAGSLSFDEYKSSSDLAWPLVATVPSVRFVAAAGAVLKGIGGPTAAVLPVVNPLNAGSI
jgi:hypothetical protein